MNEEVIKYIQNQLVQAQFRLRSYIQDEQEKKYPQRYIYIKIEKYLKDFLSGAQNHDRWIIVPGLRGVGKTTILAQLFLNYQSQVDPKRILYISLNEIVDVLGSSLKEVLEIYEKMIGESYEKQAAPLLIFIDEAQYDPKWASGLKSLYDRSNKVFVICTGSSAVSLQTNPDVIRRAVYLKLFPTSFCEYLMIKDGIYPVAGLKKKIKEALFNAESAADAFDRLKQIEQAIKDFWAKIDRLYINEYLKIGTLPFAIRMRDENRIYQTINSLLDKVIDEDVQSLGKFNRKTIGIIKRILFIMAEADSISIQKLHSILQTAPNTIMGVLDILEKAELIIRVPPHGSNVSKVRKPSKYLFMSSAIRSTFLSVAGNEQIFLQQRGRLMEDIAGMTLYREYVSKGLSSLTYDSSQGAADFILTIANKQVLPIEIGMGEKEAKQVIGTMKKIKTSKYGIIIANNDLVLIKSENIIKVPIEYFLLI